MVDLLRIVIVPEIDGIICARRVVDCADNFREIVNGRGHLRIGIDGDIANTHAGPKASYSKRAGQESGLQIVGSIVDAKDLHIVEVNQERISLGSDFQVMGASRSDVSDRILDKISPAIIFASDYELIS